MSYYTEDQKPKSKSKTLWGIGVTVAGFILTATGVSTPEDIAFLSNGFQVDEDMGLLITFAGTVLTAIGFRLAKQPVK